MLISSLLRATVAAVFATSMVVAASAKGDVSVANPNVLIKIEGVGHCSGAVINTAAGPAVLTAGHCALDGAGHALHMIDEHGKDTPLSVLYLDARHDIALMGIAGKPEIGSLDLSCKAPIKVGEHIHMTGYPLDLGRLTVEGTIASALHDIGPWPDGAIADIVAGAGNSGSAVTDDAGRVIGILVGGPGEFGPVGVVVPITDLCNPGLVS